MHQCVWEQQVYVLCAAVLEARGQQPRMHSSLAMQPLLGAHAHVQEVCMFILSSLHRLTCAGHPDPFILVCLAAAQVASAPHGGAVQVLRTVCRGKDGRGRVLCSHFLQELRVHVSPVHFQI